MVLVYIYIYNSFFGQSLIGSCPRVVPVWTILHRLLSSRHICIMDNPIHGSCPIFFETDDFPSFFWTIHICMVLVLHRILSEIFFLFSLGQSIHGSCPFRKHFFLRTIHYKVLVRFWFIYIRSIYIRLSYTQIALHVCNPWFDIFLGDPERFSSKGTVQAYRPGKPADRIYRDIPYKGSCLAFAGGRFGILSLRSPSKPAGGTQS